MLDVGSGVVYATLAVMVLTLSAVVAGRLPSERFGSVWGWIALPMIAFGLYLGLHWAPPDRDMGEVQRIMYVHFPSWLATAVAFSTAAVASALYIVTRRPKFDYWAHAGVEVGVLFTAVGLVTGSIWGRPTWGIWWTWDPRLTTTAIMFITFTAYIALRAFIEDPDRRAQFSAVVAIFAFLNLPIVYFSVKWWRTLHQTQSTPSTVDPVFVLPLRVMMLAFLLVCGWMLARRSELARRHGEIERRMDAEMA